MGETWSGRAYEMREVLEGAIAVQLVHSLFADVGPHLHSPAEAQASA